VQNTAYLKTNRSPTISFTRKKGGAAIFCGARQGSPTKPNTLLGWGPIVFSKAFINRLRPQHDKQHVLAEVIVGDDDIVCFSFSSVDTHGVHVKGRLFFSSSSSSFSEYSPKN
jgi:hypothetical protein